MLFYTFLFIHFLYSLNIHATRPIVSLYADSLGASAMVIGLLFSVYALIPMLLAIQVGKWLDRYGSWKMASLGGIGILLSLSVPILYPSLVTLFISQVVMGTCQIFVAVSLQKTVGNLPGHRDKLMATFTFVASSGGLVGPILSGFTYDYFGFRASFGLSSLAVFVALCIGVLLGRHKWGIGKASSKLTHENTSSSWSMLHHVQLRHALIISGLVLYSKDLFVAYFPVYASGLGMTPSTIGVVLSASAGMAMVVRFFQFRLVQTFGRPRVLMTSLMISGIAYLLIPLTAFPIILGVLAALLGAGLGLGQPLSLVYSLNVSPEKRQGEVLGMRLTFNRASQFFAPIIFGGIGGLLGLLPIFWVSGSILLFGTYFTRMPSSDAMSKNSI